MIEMIRPFSIKSLLKKDIKTICISLGGFYAVFGAFALLIVKMQTMMISNPSPQTDDSFTNTLKVLHEIWIIYMPFMILIGICYISFIWTFFSKNQVK